MLHPSTKRLIDTLGERTRQKKVAWAESESGAVTHDTEGYRVEITAEPHTIFLLDSLGKELDKVEPHEYSEATDDDDRPYTQFVSELYREAHRHARGTELAIEKLLAGLADDNDDTEDATPEIPEIDEIEDTVESVSTLSEPAETEELPEPQIEETESKNIWPATAANGLAVLASSDIEERNELTDDSEAIEHDSVPEPESVDEENSGASVTSEENTSPETDTLPENLVQENSIEVSSDEMTDDTATLSNTVAPEPVDSLPSFGSVVHSSPETKTIPESEPPFEDPTEEVNLTADSDNTSEFNIDEPGETDENSEGSTQDRLAGFAPVDIEDSSHAYVPTETPIEVKPEPPKQGYSLSGIGAGFGLGSAPAKIDSLPEVDEDLIQESLDTASDQTNEVIESTTNFIDGTTDLSEEPLNFDADTDITPQETPVADESVETLESVSATLDESSLEDAVTEPNDDKPSDDISGIFSGILQRGRSAGETVEEPAESTEDNAHKVIDDLNEEDAVDEDIKPKSTPRFNPWN